MCLELVHESRPPTPPCHKLSFILKEQVAEHMQGAASARSLWCETVKPVFIEDRVASLMEAIADAHASLLVHVVA